ncbi:unnamed protein product [Absidia cylindrospora]
MNDTTIMTGISTVPVGTANTTLLPMNTSTETSQPPDYFNEVSGLSNNDFLDDTTVCSTSLSLLEHTPTIPHTINKNITTAETASTPIMIHESENELDTYQALATRSPVHNPTNFDTVDLTTLPKPCFKKVTDDADQSVRTTTNKAASTKPRRNSNKRKSKTSGEASTESAGGSDTEYDDGDKSYDDISDDGGTGSCRKDMGFRRPENHYIRYIEPTEQSLLETVEYDMDEQDDAWLQMLNVERKINRLGHVSCSFFENVIDKLEKEWFDLVKHIPKQVDSEPLLSEDSACSICDDGECENSNAIVFCDGCNLAVHQDCYGVPYIPEGQWLCRKCMVSPDKPVSCLFCPNEGGAFKQTNTNKWGHLLCAIGFRRHGACIQCDNKHCFTAFHVTCARWARLCMRMKSYGAHYDSVLLKAYCDRHTPRDYRDEVDVEKCVLAAQKFLDPKAPKNQGRPSSSCIPRRRYVDELDADSNNDMECDGENDGDDVDDKKHTSGKQLSTNRKRKRSSKNHQQVSERRPIVTTSQQLTPSIKAARAHQHHYSAGAPIVPDYILTRLENLKCVRQATHLRRRCQLIASICRYWSLKRESRRGAPLLKRLHLEPWTASSSQSKQNELEKAQRAKALFELRADLEIVRMLSEQVQKREKQKLEKLRRQKEYIEMVLFPMDSIIRPILSQLMEMDKKEYFLYPVTPDVAPDYLQFIERPMSFHDIIEKLAAHEYATLDAIETDLSLIWTNSKTYNESDTSYYKLAQRMEEQATVSMAKAQQHYKSLDISQHTGSLAIGIDPDIFSYSLAQNLSPVTKMESEMIGRPGLGYSKDTNETGQRGEEMMSTKERMELAQSTTQLTSTAKRQDIRTMATKKHLNSLPKRTTRSSSPASIHINLDNIPRKRRKRIPKVSPSTPTPAPLSLSFHSNSMSTYESPQESQPSEASIQVATPITGNDQIESTTMQFSTSLPANQQRQLSPSILSERQLQQYQQQPLMEATSIESHPYPFATSRASSNISLASYKSPSHITQNNRLQNDAILSRRRTRSTGSDGLTIPTKSGMKNRKMNKETRKLLMPDTADKPIAYEEGSYKESTTRRAPCGYVYISSSDEDEEEEDNDHSDRKDSMTGNRWDSNEISSSAVSSTGNNITTSQTGNSHTSTIESDTKLVNSTGSNTSKKQQQPNTPSAKKAKSKSIKPPMPNEELHTTTPGEIVWARVPSFPFHPAKIVDQQGISQKLLMNRTKEKTVLVKFYQVPESHRWGWIKPAHIYKFGNEENDRIMLEQAKAVKRNKKSRFNEVFEGYEYVCLKLGLQVLQI